MAAGELEPLELAGVLGALDDAELADFDDVPELPPLTLAVPLPPAEPDDVPVPEVVVVGDGVVCVDPGRIVISAPTAKTLAKDAVTVVVVRRRLPWSRSATACAIWRAAA